MKVFFYDAESTRREIGPRGEIQMSEIDEAISNCPGAIRQHLGRIRRNQDDWRAPWMEGPVQGSRCADPMLVVAAQPWTYERYDGRA